MLNQKLSRHIIAILAISLTLHATAEKCDCKTSSSGSTVTVLPPPNPTVGVQNSYGAGVSIGYEIWTGSNLQYKEGVVYGDSLSKVYTQSALPNGNTDSSIATINYDGSFIIVVGVNDGSQLIYVTSKVFTNFKNSQTLTFTSNGTIN